MSARAGVLEMELAGRYYNRFEVMRALLVEVTESCWVCKQPIEPEPEVGARPLAHAIRPARRPLGQAF